MGMSLTFAALGLLILAMFLLERLTRSKTRPSAAGGVPKETPLERDTEAEEIAAAIGVALAHFRSLEICRGDLGVRLEAGHGAWWRAGRTHQSPLREVKSPDGSNQP